MLRRAIEGNYAVGYFESWNLESLQGVIDAAEQTRSPIIIGFNGEFLSGPARVAAERIAWYGALGKAAAQSASVPCGVLFNECSDDGSVRLAIASGFNSVMPADPNASYENYVGRVAELTKLAHRRGIAVEAEIGELPRGESGKMEDTGYMTDPELAENFVHATSVDVLAVSVGNVHVLVKGRQELDFSRLEAILAKVKIPLDLHGGTGITDNSLRQAVSMGIAKVAFGTYLKQRYLEAIRRSLKTDEVNPHKLLGFGGEEDVMVLGRRALREAVLERIELLGCCGKA
jgi:ketose-bisphosphate aldolase